LAEQGVTIATVYHDFRSSNRLKADDTLLSEVESMFQVASIQCALIMFVRQTGSVTGQLQVVHGFWKYRGNPMRPSPYDGKTYAYVGDVLGTVIRSVDFDSEQLNTIDTVTVTTDTTYQNQLYVDNLALELLPEHPTGATNTRSIKTRRAMYLLYPLVEYVLGKALNARQTYELFEPVIAANNWTASCAKLLEFLFVAGTAPTGATEPATLVDRIGGGEVPIEVLFDMQKEVLHRHLPQLNPVNITYSCTNDRLADILQDFSTLQATDMQDKADARAVKVLPPSISKRYGPELYDLICRLTHIVCYTDAPAVYQELAARTKNGSEVNILHSHFRKNADILDMIPPTVQSSHLNLTKRFGFDGYDKTKLARYLGPFINVPHGAVSAQVTERIQEKREAMENYATMTCAEGLGIVTLADAKVMTSE